MTDKQLKSLPLPIGITENYVDCLSTCVWLGDYDSIP